MVALPSTLPASWFTSEPLLQLERRAIFFKSWYFLGPINRFQDRNETVTYEIAGVKLLVRNTASPADGFTTSGITVSTVDGHPAKTHFTHNGLIFAALSQEPECWEEYYKGLEPLIQNLNFKAIPYRKSLKYEGRFNWKTMIDGYQECLHCSIAHPEFAKRYPTSSYAVVNYRNFSRHLTDPGLSIDEDGLFLYMFPICTLNLYGGGMSSFRACPTKTPGVTRMEFDYYYMGTEEEFEDYYKFVRQVADEDFHLCEKAQKNLEQGIYNEGVLNPIKEMGVAYYQDKVRMLVHSQHEAEMDTRLELQQES